MTIKREDVEKIAEALAAMAEMPLEGENTDPLIEVMHSQGHQAAAMLRALLAERDEGYRREQEDVRVFAVETAMATGVATTMALKKHAISPKEKSYGAREARRAISEAIAAMLPERIGNGVEPPGCPTPGACSAYAAPHRKALENARNAALEEAAELLYPTNDPSGWTEYAKTCAQLAGYIRDRMTAPVQKEPTK